MNKIFGAFGLSLFFCMAFGQSPVREFPKNPPLKDSVSTDTLLIINEMVGKLLEADSSSMFFNKIVDTSGNKVKFILKDIEIARRYDSLHLRRLYDADLFDSIYTVVNLENYPDSVLVDLPTDTLKARLQKLDAKTPFKVIYHPILESVIKTFLKRRPQSLQRLLNLSEYYYPMFERVLDAEGVPLEIKHLAVVESALNPLAKSRVGATGLWQFMYQTGKMYHLDLNSYVDERSDPLKSTEAAASYLADLYQIFGDWDLVLAAYNSGPGNVNKAIRRSGGYDNYWSIRPFLPRETQGYLPAFLATFYIFEYAEEHGLQRGRTQIKLFETDTIRVKKSLTFKQLSDILDVSQEDLAFLNPAYKLKVIPYVVGKNYTVRLPKYHSGLFVNNENEIYAYLQQEEETQKAKLPDFEAIESATVYRVRSGDYLGKIAERFGVTVSQLKQWNGLRSNNLRIGQRLTIYPKNPMAKTTQNSNKSTQSKGANAENGQTQYYTVQPGDSLWSIAQKFQGVSVEKLKAWNGIRGNNLKPGMKLKMMKI